METPYMTVARHLQNIAEKLKRNEISFAVIPFDEIISLIQDTYEKEVQNGELFVQIYGELLSKGLENSDKETVANTLLLLSQHILIIAMENRRIKNLNSISHSLQCRLSHKLNCDKVKAWHEANGPGKKIPFTGKGVVYSAVIGNYDAVQEPEYVDPDLDYIMFTDNPAITSKVWQIRLVEREEGLDHVRMARKIKILGHQYLPEYAYSVWLDGNLKIVGDLQQYIARYRQQEPILCVNHCTCDCIYKEMERCATINKDSVEVMEKQIARYRQEGYPEHNGLIESGILVRDIQDEQLQKVMEVWWQEVLNGSKRDQLSFNYACWKQGFVYDTSDIVAYENAYTEYYDHS